MMADGDSNAGWTLLQQELAATPSAPSADALAAVRAAAAPPAQAPSFWQSVGQGARDVVQGAASLPGLVYDTTGAAINLGERGLEKLTGADLSALRIHPAAQNLDDLMDAAGLPRHPSAPAWQSQMIRALAAVPGGVGIGAALAGAAPAASIAGQVGEALQAAPGAQTAAAAASGASSIATAPLAETHPVAANLIDAAAGLVAGGTPSGMSAALRDGATGRMADAARAIGTYDIPLSAGDISGNRLVRTLTSINQQIPWGGAAAHDQAVREGFTRALSRTMGEDAPSITPDVMTRARARIGAQLDSVANRTAIDTNDPAIGNPLWQQLGDIESHAHFTTGASPGQPLPAQAQQVQNLIDDVQNRAAANGGQIPGQVFQAMIQRGSPLDLMQRSRDTLVSNYAQQVENALWDAWQGSVSPADRAALTNARFQYKNMKTLEPLAEKAQATDGLISPALVQQAARSSFDDMAYSGAGPLGELGNIGQQFLKAPPDSGTAMRSYLMGVLSHPLQASPAVASTLGMNRLLGAGLRSDWLRNQVMAPAGPGLPPAVPLVSLLAPTSSIQTPP